MGSLTKNRVGEETIKRMISKAFADGREDVCLELTELTEGYYNIAFCVKLTDGREVILKIAPPAKASVLSYENNIMEAEVEATRLVKKHTIVPVPEVLCYDKSHELCDADYFFMSRIPGRNFYTLEMEGGITEKEKKEILTEAGRYNRMINTVAGESFGYLAQPESWSDSWEKSFGKMISLVLFDGKKAEVELGIPYDRIEKCIEKSLPFLRDVTSPKLVHWDLWNGNIFMEHGKISGMIDFERAMWADPGMEYFFRAHASNEDFVKGYGEDLRMLFPKKAVLYDLYLYLIMSIEPTYRQYPDDGQYQFAVAELRKAMDILEN